jgi:hypothetical protein
VTRHRLLTGIEHLNADDQVTFKVLGDRFRFKDVLAKQGGKSDSNAKRFINKCSALTVIKKDGKEYVKTVPVVERVDPVE